MDAWSWHFLVTFKAASWLRWQDLPLATRGFAGTSTAALTVGTSIRDYAV